MSPFHARERADGAPALWDRGEVLPADAFPASRVLLATSLPSRMKGLLFTPQGDDVMVLVPCHDIHTFGMRYALDVAFIDAAGVVRKAERDVMPNRRLRDAGSVAVLERRAIPREVWFDEGEQVSLGRFERVPLTGSGKKPAGDPDGAGSGLPADG